MAVGDEEASVLVRMATLDLTHADRGTDRATGRETGSETGREYRILGRQVAHIPGESVGAA
eukprot:COSAG03_NODE_962_length_5181_cov_8.358520_5_plen_61_part_00